MTFLLQTPSLINFDSIQHRPAPPPRVYVVIRAQKKREIAFKSIGNVAESRTNDGDIKRGWWKQF